MRRVLDAVLSVAARGGSPRAIADEALRTASRLERGVGRLAGDADATVGYRARSGDVMDYIAWRQYGAVDAVISTLHANPELADAGPRLAAGTVVGLPDQPPPPQAPGAIVQLWGTGS